MFPQTLNTKSKILVSELNPTRTLTGELVATCVAHWKISFKDSAKDK
jgi:hypothetical protein